MPLACASLALTCECARLSCQVPHWSKEDVETWLVEVVQLPQYAQIFVENDVDGELLLWLRERNLQEDLEITSLLHRKKITAQIVRTTPA